MLFQAEKYIQLQGANQTKHFYPLKLPHYRHPESAGRWGEEITCRWRGGQDRWANA